MNATISALKDVLLWFKVTALLEKFHELGPIVEIFVFCDSDNYK